MDEYMLRDARVPEYHAYVSSAQGEDQPRIIALLESSAVYAEDQRVPFKVSVEEEHNHMCV